MSDKRERNVLDMRAKKRSSQRSRVIRTNDRIFQMVPQEQWLNSNFYRDVHRCISRFWKCHLSSSEYSVLDMILDRTIGWGKPWETISLKHFTEGVFSRDDDRKPPYSEGTGLGKRTVQRAIKALVERGMIFCEPSDGETSVFAINLAWRPTIEILESDPVEVRLRKYQRCGVIWFWTEGAAPSTRHTCNRIQKLGDDFYYA